MLSHGSSSPSWPYARWCPVAVTWMMYPGACPFFRAIPARLPLQGPHPTPCAYKVLAAASSVPLTRSPMPRRRDLASLGSPGLTAALCLRRLSHRPSSAPFRADWRLPQGFPKNSPPSGISSRISVTVALREAARGLRAAGCLLSHVRIRGSSPPLRFDPPAGLRACCVPLPTLGFIGFP